MLGHRPLFGYFLLTVSKESSKALGKTIPTAAVYMKGLDTFMYFNEEFHDSLTKEQQNFLLAHEVSHLIYRHLIIGPKLWPNHKMANLAEDIFINETLMNNNSSNSGGVLYEFIEGGQRSDLYKFPNDKSTTWYYNKLDELKQSAEKKINKYLKGQISKEQKAQGKGKGKGSGKGKGEKKEGEGQGGSGMGDDMMDKAGLNDPEKNVMKSLREIELDDSLFKHVRGGGENLTDTQRQILDNHVKNNIKAVYNENKEKIEKSRSNMGSGINTMLDDILDVYEENFDWKAFFRRFIGSSLDVKRKKTRKRDSKRFPDMPGTRKKTKHKILVLQDVSGSISHEDHKEFYSEVHHMYKKGIEVDIVEWNTVVESEKPLKFKGKIPELVHRGGGTVMQSACDYFAKHSDDYTCAVYFTDLYVDHYKLPRINKPQLVLVCSTGAAEDQFESFEGHIIKMNDGEKIKKN